MNTLRKNLKLVECSAESLWESFNSAAIAGLEIGGPVADCYLVPYKTECQLIIGYRGLITLARRAGCRQVVCEVVRENDTYTPSANPLDRTPSHVIGNDPRGKITAVYCGYVLENGSSVWDYMTTEEVEAHKKATSQSWKKPDSPWQKHWQPMAMKTVLKRPIARGLVPIATLLDTADKPERAAVLDRLVTTDEPLRIEAEPEPEVLDADQLNTMARNCADMSSCDNKQKELIEQYPDQRQEIFDALEARRESIARVEEQTT